MQKKVVVLWKNSRPKGTVEILHGTLKNHRDAERFSPRRVRARLEITVADAALHPGPESTLVTVRAERNPFSFFLRDVSRHSPIFIPAYGVAVTEAGDPRDYARIAGDVRARLLETELERIEREPEESYDATARDTRNMRVPTWLGLTRDIRVFELDFRDGREAWFWVQPRFHGYPVTIDGAPEKVLRYHYLLGRGMACVERNTRRLDEGVLPILHGTQVDDDIEYRFTAFVTFESKPLTERNLHGTDFRVADRFSYGIMMTEEEKKQVDARLHEELSRDEETVLYFRAEAANQALVPRYAWFRSPFPALDGSWVFRSTPTDYDAGTGFASLKSGGVFCVSRLDGQPLPQEEVAVLVPPGKHVTFEFRIPHRPVPIERATKLAGQDFAARLDECRRFWKRKLAVAAKVSLPEKRIDEMLHAGLLHLDLITYGRDPDGPLAATVGVYSPIGSESSPIIQFMDSAGWHDTARRVLEYFLEKQRPDGFMINFGGYQLETGGVLWSLGEHYRLTRDDAWVKRIEPKLLKACDYILAWRRRNQRPELRGRGWGLVDGKVADPEDPYHAFMLNGIMAIGMSRVAEMLAKTDGAESKRLAHEASAFRRDIRRAFAGTMAGSPVVPLGDGSWCPTVAPWTEGRGPVCLFVEKGEWFTHGAFPARDSLIGPLYLILHEILGPHEPAADFLLNYHAELMHVRNVALSQPYYSPHPFAHLRRGEVKAFLKEYYNGFAGLADRETYSFWEHYHHASPHKTHEEGWFLMQTRWMLWLEEASRPDGTRGPGGSDTLRLLAGIPRAWLEDGKRIDIEGAASYFGPLALHVKSSVARGRIDAKVRLDSHRRPKRVEIRLPHPQELKASRCTGGTYDAATETVRIDRFHGRAKVTLEF